MRLGLVALALFAPFVAALTAHAATPEEHLLAGARAFKAGQFADALLEFRAAERGPGAPGASWYVAATLLELGEIEDALASFLDAEAAAPEHRDELLDFYFATAYAEARLYTAADRMLVSVSSRAGPKITAQVESMRVKLAPLLGAEPPSASIDWYEARGKEALARGRSRLARVYFEEALACARRARPAYRVQELEDALQHAGAR